MFRKVSSDRQQRLKCAGDKYTLHTEIFNPLNTQISNTYTETYVSLAREVG